MDAYAKAKEELREIDIHIAALQQRKVALRQFVDLGEALFREGGHEGPTLTAATGHVGISLNNVSLRVESAKARILAGCESIIRRRGATPARELVTALDSMGIEVGGADKLANLSALRSKSNQFVSDRKLGWSLAVNKEQTPQASEAPAGSDVGLFQSVPGEGTGSTAG
jgi:hypothetical protein